MMRRVIRAFPKPATASITSGGFPLDGDDNGTVGDDFVDQHYVAIPGNANLDGTANVLGDAFALVSNLNSTTSIAWADGNFNGDGVVNTLGDAFVLVSNLNRGVRPPVEFAASTANFARDITLPSSNSSEADEQDASASSRNSSSPTTKQPQLVLTGDRDLRDDVFGSDF